MSNIFLTNSMNSSLNMHECGQDEYWFYYKNSHPNSHPLLYKKIVDEANSEIIIWDPYFNVKEPGNDQSIFSDIKDNIKIKILTMKGMSGTEYLSNVKNALKMIIPPAKNCRFGLKVINKGDTHNHGGSFFHDRFLIIDESEVYLIGSSLGYHIKPEQSTGIYKVSNTNTKKFIMSIFSDFWNKDFDEISLTYLHND